MFCFLGSMFLAISVNAQTNISGNYNGKWQLNLNQSDNAETQITKTVGDEIRAETARYGVGEIAKKLEVGTVLEISANELDFTVKNNDDVERTYLIDSELREIFNPKCGRLLRSVDY